MQAPELVPTARPPMPAGNGEMPEEPKVVPRRPQIESYAVEFPVSEELDMANLSLMINPALSAEALAADVDRQMMALRESARAVVERRATQEREQRVAESERARQVALVEETLSALRIFAQSIQAQTAARLQEQYEQPTIVVNVPQQAPPVVNVNIPPNAIRVEISEPPEVSETMEIQRNPDGTIARIRKVKE